MKTTPYANSLFEQPWWLDIVAPNQWDDIIVHEDDKAVARMPYVIDKNRIIMPISTQNIGIWIDEEKLNNLSCVKKYINFIFCQFNDKKSIRVALSPCNNYVLPFRWLGYRITTNFTYRITDLDDCEKIYNSFSKTAKKNIKYARNKVNISSECNIDILYDMLNKTYEVQNRKNPMPKEVLHKIVETCEKNDCGKYFVAKDNEGNVHSCAYFVYDEQVCYYLIGASDSRFRSSGAQSLIIWSGIQFASKHSRVFDFEGSMVEGIENFFRQFGGECTPYYEVSKLPLIEEILEILKPKIKKLLGYKL